MSIFERFRAGDVRALIEAYPLAWVCAAGGDGIEASLLPLVGRYDEDGMPIELIGHLMRTNPLHALLKRRPQATILFKGPDAYVSPEHAGKRVRGELHRNIAGHFDRRHGSRPRRALDQR